MRGPSSRCGRGVAVLASLLCVALTLLFPLSARGAREKHAAVVALPDSVSFQPNIGYGSVRITVNGPGGFQAIQSFGPDEALTVELPGTDGLYKYELRFAPDLDAAARRELAEAREAGIEVVEAGDRGLVQSGWFTIAGGAVVPSLREDAAAKPGTSIVIVDPQLVLSNGDGVIRNSLCVGFDCPDAPLFDDSTILLMENNTRIKFGDTSNSPFPNNDWEIEANSSLSGGASYLGFNDCGTADNDGGCASDLVFAVESGARASALYVEDDGDVGIGTSLPVLDLHIVTGNTPALRLDQDGSAGFSPQVWDVAGNETNFFVRDVTAGSRLPLRIRAGASTNSLDIQPNGDVKFQGTSDGDLRLYVDSGAAADDYAELMFTQSGADKWSFGLFQGAYYAYNYQTSQYGMRIDASNNVGLNCFNNADDLTIGSGANSCKGGAYSTINAGQSQFTTSSSRAIKENLAPVAVDGLLDKIAAAEVYTYDFIDGSEGAMGLMAEDFHPIFGRGPTTELSGNDVQIALWLAVQELTAQNRELSEKLAAVTERLAALEAE